MLSANEIVKTLKRDGVVMVENQLDDERCRQALEGIEWGMRNKTGPFKFHRQRTYEWFQEFPVFFELIEFPLVIEVVEGYLGPDFHLICAEVTRNQKENHYLPGVKKIHQDTCFFPNQPKLKDDIHNRPYGLTAQWVLLDIPPEMGPTEFILGSHTSSEKYTDEDLTPKNSFSRFFPKGSIVFYDHRTWHRGTDTFTETNRDLPQNCYAVPAIDKVQIMTPQPDDEEIYIPCEELLANGSDTLRKLLEPREVPA